MNQLATGLVPSKKERSDPVCESREFNQMVYSRYCLASNVSGYTIHMPQGMSSGEVKKVDFHNPVGIVSRIK
jgi:acyl dehydratase